MTQEKTGRAYRDDPSCLPDGYRAAGGGPSRRPRSGRGGHRRSGHGLRALLPIPAALSVLIVLFLAVSVVGAATTPGNQGFKAKWADWLRAHHAAFVVNPMEKWYYSSHAPAKGGRPKALNHVPTAGSRSLTATQPVSTHLAPPTPVPLVVQPALPGEGMWQPTGPLIDGHYGMYVAQFRADTVYTSQITSAVWIDPTLLRLRLVPGAQEPGGTWTTPPDLTGTAAARAVAAFNGGFRFQDAQGGFYLDGRTAVPLRAGAASVVIYKDGRVNVGAWGSEVTMTPDVEAVLQNLVPLVDHGQIAPDATYHDTHIWGNTLGANTVVARSGIGVTSSGAVVYVAGPALTAKTLAESLQRAGAVRGMTLDINPEWVTFNFFTHPNAADPAQTVGSKLYPTMQRPADRYLGPGAESRDFFSISTS
ncbi:MAG TPA: phosphodiester glycosidase family protein [Acidimicrobiales bacterium]|nr:phosphodiester glycosidase family protein [Acidimicrobiales bacterium]